MYRGSTLILREAETAEKEKTVIRTLFLIFLYIIYRYVQMYKNIRPSVTVCRMTDGRMFFRLLKNDLYCGE